MQATGYDVTYSYTYDDNGNILSIFDGTYTTSYVYDSANQLIRENNQAGGFTHTWEYDHGGNILNRKEYAYTTGTLGTPLDTVTYTYDDEMLWGDLLYSYDGQNITLDDIGNTLFDGTWTYTWEHGRGWRLCPTALSLGALPTMPTVCVPSAQTAVLPTSTSTTAVP